MTENNIKLADLIDLDFLQEFQDFFAKNMGIAAITTDENGPITKASNFTGFCSKFVRGKKESLEKCDAFHTVCGKIAAEKGETYVYTCPNGLTEFAVPIIIKGKYIASVIGGQFFSEPPNEEDYKKVIKNSGVDEKEYLNEIKSINVIPSPKIKEMGHLLTLLVKNIENIAIKNFELIETDKREKISRSIIEILRSTLDKNMIKHLFVRNIGKFFNADRVFFSDFDASTNTYLPVDDQSEYLSNQNEKSFINFDFSNPTIQGFLDPLLNKRELIIKNWNEYIKNHPQDAEFMALYKDANIKSGYKFPVIYEGKLLGFFCLDYTHDFVELPDEDINRVRIICTQAGIALYQAELYTEAQKALQSKGELIEKVKNGIEEPVDNILKTSKILSEQELEHNKQQAHLDTIINSCNKLIELTKDIQDVVDSKY